MFGSLASKLSLARMPSCTFQAASTLLPGSFQATLLPSSITCLFSTSSLSMSDSGGRWWSDRIANKKRRRLGYHDRVKQEGPLPRVRDDSARITQAPSYKPSNSWSPSKALAGQNDYIDILGSEDLHPKHLLYHVPQYLKGVHRNEKHFQIQLRRQKALEHTKFPDAYPSKWQGWRLTTLQNHRWLNRRVDQNWWANYQGIKEGPVKNPFKPHLFEMVVHNLYLFDRNGTLLFYHEWLRRKHTSMSKEEEAKLLYGMLFSMKSFVAKLSPNDMKQGFLSYVTSAYRLNFLETASGLKFVLNTDTESSQTEIRELIRTLYASVYVEYAAKNPMSVPGEMITSNLFRTKVDEHIKNSNIFKHTPAKNTS